MSLSQPRIIYGIHAITPYKRSDHTPYGIMKVIGSADLTLSTTLEKLFAGSNKFAWAAEAKTIDSELKMKVKQYPDFLFQLFIGATVTTNSPDSSGTVSGLANVKGTSVFDVTNGLASVTVVSASKANLSFGRYVLVATGAGTADLYLLHDVDAARGVAKPYLNDQLKIGTIDISSATDDDGTLNGLSFTKVGTPAFVTGDTAEFDVAPPSSASSDIIVGASTTQFSAFGTKVVAQKRSTGEIFDIEAYNCVADGLPITMNENAYSQPEVKLACLYDSVKDAVFKIKACTPL